MLGTVFDIQRFSVHDGPGIRTTVFMKGCPLRCQWCHNPEGLTRTPQLQFFAESCVGCGACGSRSDLADAERCRSGALKVCGRQMSADEVVTEVLRDRIFYAENGGVTFSGGECLLQADFVVEVLSEIKKLGLSTAIDTSGYVPACEIEKTLPVCDLYLYDVKCMDPQIHKAYTGVDNRLILSNLRLLSEAGKEIWVRVPVIPDFNDRTTEMEAIADLVASLPTVRQVTLMPYHTLGAGKYETLGMTYPFDRSKKVNSDSLAAFERIFTGKGIVVT